MLHRRFWKRCIDHKWSRPDPPAKECSHRVTVWLLRSADIASRWWKRPSLPMEWRVPGLRDSTWIPFPNSSNHRSSNNRFINSTTNSNNTISNKRSNSLMTKKWFGMTNRSPFRRRPFPGPVSTSIPATFRYRLIYDGTGRPTQRDRSILVSMVYYYNYYYFYYTTLR